MNRKIFEKFGGHFPFRKVNVKNIKKKYDKKKEKQKKDYATKDEEKHLVCAISLEMKTASALTV